MSDSMRHQPHFQKQRLLHPGNCGSYPFLGERDLLRYRSIAGLQTTAKLRRAGGFCTQKFKPMGPWARSSSGHTRPNRRRARSPEASTSAGFNLRTRLRDRTGDSACNRPGFLRTDWGRGPDAQTPVIPAASPAANDVPVVARLPPWFREPGMYLANRRETATNLCRASRSIFHTSGLRAATEPPKPVQRSARSASGLLGLPTRVKREDCTSALRLRPISDRERTRSSDCSCRNCIGQKGERVAIGAGISCDTDVA